MADPLSFYTRREAGKVLKLSTKRVRDFEDEGRLISIVDAKGVHRYPAAAVLALAAARGGKKGRPGPKPKNGASAPAPGDVPATANGQTASLVFTKLRQGATKIAIVCELAVHPDVADELTARYKKMEAEEKGQPVISTKCAKCGEGAARFCGGCT